ncbi:MAG: hypothetical protein ISQ64_02220 [SAR86 cluster bacterium]|uniref:Uncharacterized protein n=1 Tax=SAR86 cluster bacterium TaxID=2030880 RepID=A0A937I515_9GAMM|nr:hypothetical protein [SAR86 cluster bacterium]
MKKFTNKTLILLSGLLFLTSLSAHPFLHDHIGENQTLIECQLYDNKTSGLLEGDEAVSDFVESSIIKELKIEDISQCHSKNYQSRAPPKN